MAITKLPTNYTDDIVDTTANAHRLFKMTATSTADVYELDEETVFIQKGTDYKASDVNNTNSTVNSVIDVAEDSATKVDGIIDGTITVPSAIKAFTSDSATKSDSATNATNADKSTTSVTALSVDNDFILINKQALTFTDAVCTLSDTRITENSLADVYYTKETKNVAETYDIIAETSTGKLKLTASSQPTGSIVATIRIRVV